MASLLYKSELQEEISPYYKNKQNMNFENIKNSSTIYIGNLSYSTSETQLYQLFSSCGKIKRVIMGLNRFNSAPCGFAFIEFLDKESAKTAIKTLMGTILDGREIRVDIDEGYSIGREFGRGMNGVQKRDEMNKNDDPHRPWRKNRPNNNYNRGNSYKYNDSKRYRRRSGSRYRKRSRSKSMNRSRSNHKKNKY